MAQKELEAIQGISLLLFARKLSEAGKVAGMLIPYQTSISFDPQRDSDSTPTKSGSITTSSTVSTDLEVEFVNNFSKIADQFQDSLFDGDKMEFWLINRQRQNAEGKYWATYMRGTVSEDEWDGDPDDVANRDVSFAIDGTPKRGWTTLPAEAQEQIDYVFRGLGVVESAKNDGTDGGGKAWNPSDTGLADDQVVAG